MESKPTHGRPKPGRSNGNNPDEISEILERARREPPDIDPSLPFADALRAAHEQEAKRMDVNPETEDVIRHFHTLLFDSAHSSLHTTNEEIQELARIWNLEVPPPPPEWRINLWKRILGKDIFAAISISTNPDASPFENGLQRGALICFVRTYEKSFSICPFSTPSTTIGGLSNRLLNLKSIEDALINHNQEDAIEYLKGMQKGIGSFTTETGEVVKENMNQSLYFALIDHTYEVNKMDTIEELHAFLKENLKQGLPHSFDSFKVLCNRIGLRGRNYRTKASG